MTRRRILRVSVSPCHSFSVSFYLFGQNSTANCPSPLFPQQAMEPTLRRAQLCQSPVLTCVKVPGGFQPRSAGLLA